MTETCIDCETRMVLDKTTIRGVMVECYKCPECKEKIFTEEQTRLAVQMLEASRLAKEYKKPILQIGGSLAVTIPKDIAEVFHLKGRQVTIKPLLDQKKIEIRVA